MGKSLFNEKLITMVPISGFQFHNSTRKPSSVMKKQITALVLLRSDGCTKGERTFKRPEKQRHRICASVEAEAKCVQELSKEIEITQKYGYSLLYLDLQRKPATAMSFWKILFADEVPFE